jgi:threonine dehydrogenase-like Zn-dependent dehydrogenase
MSATRPFLIRESRTPDDAFIKVTSCAICGSTLHFQDGYMPTVESRDVLGHETVGRVVEVGRAGIATVGHLWDCGPVGQFAMQSAWLVGAGRMIAIDYVPSGRPHPSPPAAGTGSRRGRRTTRPAGKRPTGCVELVLDRRQAASR